MLATSRMAAVMASGLSSSRTRGSRTPRGRDDLPCRATHAQLPNWGRRVVARGWIPAFAGVTTSSGPLASLDLRLVVAGPGARGPAGVFLGIGLGGLVEQRLDL